MCAWYIAVDVIHLVLLSRVCVQQTLVPREKLSSLLNGQLQRRLTSVFSVFFSVGVVGWLVGCFPGTLMVLSHEKTKKENKKNL